MRRPCPCCRLRSLCCITNLRPPRTGCLAPLRRVPTPRRFLRRDPHRTSVSDAPFRRRAPISSVCAASQNRPLDAVDDCGAFRRPAEAAERLAGRPSFVAKSLWRRAGVDDIFLRARACGASTTAETVQQRLRLFPVLLGGQERRDRSGVVPKGAGWRLLDDMPLFGETVRGPRRRRSTSFCGGGANRSRGLRRAGGGGIHRDVEGRASVQSPAAVALPPPRRAANMRRHAHGASPAHSHAGLSWA